ncbi:MAG: hypothetical protein EOM26_12125 [Alphaproteobacteria bacterium]|nr:hypothetical protein [Alphaproteobacteria bacterium]
MARFRKITAEIDWKGYEGNAAIFPVCMRSPAVHGRSLSAQLQAASDKVENLIMIVCDSLDRHNFSVSDPLQCAIQYGSDWLDANLQTVREYFPSVEVLRWETDIRPHPSFEKNLAVVKSLYASSSEVKRLRDALSLYYLQSKYKRYEDDVRRGFKVEFDIDGALESCGQYLDEEFAGDMVYYEICHGLPHIYWGLYVDDEFIFSKASGRSLPFPQTLPVELNRHGPSVAASSLNFAELSEFRRSLSYAHKIAA